MRKANVNYAVQSRNGHIASKREREMYRKKVHAVKKDKRRGLRVEIVEKESSCYKD